jgi:hypothetical protein
MSGVALLGCAAILTLSSCSKKTSSAIIGKWRVQGQGETVQETIQFHKDGTFTSSEDGNGTYTFADDNHMKLEINDTNAPLVLNYTVQIHGDAMDVTMDITGANKPIKLHLNRIK